MPARKLASIPVGHYHDVMVHGTPMRRAWHILKFTRVLECLPDVPGQSILDVGCFAGSFLSLLSEERFGRQVGVDILPEQIEYANAHFGTAFRQFRHVKDITEISSIEGSFDCATLIEVIEHLRPEEIDPLFRQISAKLRPGGRLVISTPNYTSSWPVLEMLLNRFSDVTYDEQHITRFHYFNCLEKLTTLSPTLARDFQLCFKTTTHLASPFLAFLGVNVAKRISATVAHRHWKMPFGNLLLMAFERR